MTHRVEVIFAKSADVIAELEQWLYAFAVNEIIHVAQNDLLGRLGQGAAKRQMKMVDEELTAANEMVFLCRDGEQWAAAAFEQCVSQLLAAIAMYQDEAG